MKKITLTLLLFAPLFAFAQSFQWLKTPPISLSLNPDAVGYVSAVDVSGNAYFAGFKDDAFPYTNVFGNQYFAKYNAAGELLFSKTITGHSDVLNMVSDADGNIFMAASYVNAFSVDGLSLSTPNQDVMPLLLKFDANGNLLWHFAPEADENGLPASQFGAIAVDAQNNIYLGYDHFLKSYVVKLSPDGMPLMTITQNHVRAITSVSVDNAGNIYSAGSCAESNAEFAGVANVPSFGYNTYIAKYDASGVFRWVKFVEDVTCPLPQVRAFSPDAVYFSSYLFGPVSFDGFIAEGPVDAFGFADVFVAKLNASGAFQWVREVPGAGQLMTGNRNFVAVDHNDNVYLAGKTRGTIQWNQNTSSGPTGGFSNDAILLKYSPDGEVLMAVTAGGNGEDRFDSVAVDANGGIYASGMAMGLSTFGELTHNGDALSNYPFFTKIETLLTTTTLSSSGKPVIYPNPFTDYLFIERVKGEINGSLYNALGVKVKDFNESPVFVGDLPQGVYLIKIGGTAVKVMKQ